MSRQSPTSSTIRKLFAHSGNRCGFPDCQHAVVDTATDTLIGEVAHICAAEPGGPRFDPAQSDEERRAYDNLILLCHAHHRIVDAKPDRYPADTLRGYKADHEARFASGPDLLVSDAAIDQAEAEFEQFWRRVEAERTFSTAPDMLLPIELDAGIYDILEQLRQKLQWLDERSLALADDAMGLPEKLISFLEELGVDTRPVKRTPYYQNPFERWNWELLNLGFKNFVNKTSILLDQFELRYLEQRVAAGASLEETERYERLKEDFLARAPKMFVHD